MKLEITAYTQDRFTILYEGTRWKLVKAYGMWRLGLEQGRDSDSVKLAGGTHPHELVLANALMRIRDITESAKIVPFRGGAEAHMRHRSPQAKEKADHETDR